ncbi:hypothetical protein LY76DRAFT_356341 [Colletotrichum caudatum]|nr:hypothetical protein LY76DRAFT_356341 [Colletotrichum caudatum]
MAVSTTTTVTSRPRCEVEILSKISQDTPAIGILCPLCQAIPGHALLDETLPAPLRRDCRCKLCFLRGRALLSAVRRQSPDVRRFPLCPVSCVGVCVCVSPRFYCVVEPLLGPYHSLWMRTQARGAGNRGR